MDRIRIRGGKSLKGEIRISGAKNAALPLMATSLLTDGEVRLDSVPDLADITTMTNLLAQHGVEVTTKLAGKERSVTLSGANITDTTAPYDLVRKMRASVLVLGPLVARHGQAKVSLPGGCAIGTRPVDLHIKGLQQLGAEIDLREGYMYARAPQGGLIGAEVNFPKVSVGATENLLMAATLAKGETQLINAAREPEITDLAKCLIGMGAEIEGLGTDHLRIRGVERLHGTTHKVVADRIEAGTYAMAAAITNGEVELIGVHHELIAAVCATLQQAGVQFTETPRGLKVSRANGDLLGVDVMTEPFPGFPTDLQAQMMALMTTAQGASMITETIFENRFMHVPELLRMGASINVHGASAMVRGVKRLTGAPVMATDLRASVSLVMAGLVAEGDTILNRVYHLDRGYERLVQKLAACGAEIERLADGAAE
ncbi:MAG: UDP-N-acetylglucosamine 1-carboxyvinyltransferase [Rhodospirillaceae bacterium]|jgi:UDP-N-acetylglucosamine 1-carboxyvinyltransferase|nr:UDP-N-acetylglucosamine 1-carboxyvinyltransferase [Rhodospirillaceae bacterium]